MNNDPWVGAIQPWVAPSNEVEVKNYKHPSIVIPPRYDTTITEEIGALVARHNLTSAQHQQVVDELFPQGFRPTCVSGYSIR